MQPPPPSATGLPPRFLVADDDRIHRLYLLEALQQLGYRGQGCASARQARQCLDRRPYAALLLDYHLGDQSAPTLIRWLRRRDGTGRLPLPVAVITAGLTPAARRTLDRLGVKVILAKPLGLDALRAGLAGLPPIPLLTATATADAGSMRGIEGLRQLLGEELGELAACLPALGRDGPRLAARLHQLRAGCSLCGAPVLARHAALVEQRLRRGRPITPADLQELQADILATGRALARPVARDQ